MQNLKRQRNHLRAQNETEAETSEGAVSEAEAETSENTSYETPADNADEKDRKVG